MTKKALDDKYSYQIDEHNVIHLFRRGVDCQEDLTNPLISAIFKIETLEKENAELKEKYDTYLRENTGLKIHNAYIEKKLTEAKELLNMFLRLHYNPIVDEHTLFCKVEQFLNSEVEK